MAPARKRWERVHKHLTSRPALILRPGEHYLQTTMACVKLPYFDQTARESLTGVPASKVGEQIAGLMRAGTLKVNLASEGTSLTPKGLAAKVRLIDKPALMRIAKARKAVAEAEARAAQARAALHSTLAKEYSDGAPVTLADAVDEYWAPAITAELAMKAAEARTRGRLSAWEREALIRDATAHLEHVKSKAKTPCPCIPCLREREGRQRSMLMQQRAKEEARALASMPKASFTCPTCKRDSIAPVEDGAVRCQNRGCQSSYNRSAFPISVIRTKTVPKSTPVGPVPASV